MAGRSNAKKVADDAVVMEMEDSDVTTAPAIVYQSVDDIPLPPRRHFGAKGASSALAASLDGCPVKGTFLEAVTVADNIKDTAERTKAFREECRRVSNRVSGAIRRLQKAHPERKFGIRTVSDDRAGYGVRVWRLEDETETKNGE